MKRRNLLLPVAALMALGACSTPQNTATLAPVVAKGQSFSADAAMPIVALMPLVRKHGDDLQLSVEQRRVIDAYRNEATPRRMVLQQNILALRGNLRQAMLDGAPQAERDRLTEQILAAEKAHIQARNRCLEMLRDTLSPEQFQRLLGYYWQANAGK